MDKENIKIKNFNNKELQKQDLFKHLEYKSQQNLNKVSSKNLNADFTTKSVSNRSIKSCQSNHEINCKDNENSEPSSYDEKNTYTKNSMSSSNETRSNRKVKVQLSDDFYDSSDEEEKNVSDEELKLNFAYLGIYE